MQRLTSFVLLAGTALGMLGFAGAASAQSQSEPQAQDRPVRDQSEIIVTARKREESILKVPVVEAVVSGETIAQAQITSLESLVTRVPGVNIGSAVLSIGPQISLRGVGTSSLDAGIDQSVSLNVDGLSLTQGLAYAAGVFDLAQAEVLKGPQALFFGKNSPAGVVSLRSNDPGNEVEVIARLGYEAEAQEKRGELILSTPVTDTFGVRFAGMADFQDGFFRNRAQNLTPAAVGSARPSFKYPESRSFIVRGTAVWEPSATFKARLKVNYTVDDVKGDASHGQVTTCPEGIAPSSTGILYLNPREDCKLDRDIYVVYFNPATFTGRNFGVPFIRRKQKFGTLELNYNASDTIGLTSVTGYYRVDSDSMINAVQTGFAGSPFAADNAFYRNDFTQELRLDTEFDGPLNLTLGAFYQDGEIYNQIRLPVNRAILPLPLFPNGYLANGSHHIDIEAYSGFGQLRYKIVPTLELAVGARYAHETRSDQVFNLGGATPVDISLPNRGKFSTANVSPEATLTWTPTDDFTLFGAVKQGYKSGSFTITTPSAAPAFGDEKVRGGEVGVKTRLANRQLNLNLAGYYYEYKGLQVGVSTIDPVLGITQVQTVNAASARVYGIDFDLTYRPNRIEGLMVSAAANWNKAKFDDFRDAQCTRGQTIAQGCNSNRDPRTGLFTGQDLTGIPLIRAPEWQLSGNIDYDLPVSSTDKVRLGVGAQYSSRYLTALGRGDRFYQDAYAMFDANVAYVGNDGKWEVSLLGRNLGNKITTGSCTASNIQEGQNPLRSSTQVSGAATSGSAGLPEVTCVARRGREIWARFSVSL
ncbi:TonB-dependent receptor [Novosphingobium sp. 9U]|uniref:TonB-dependent receptor n=1 Tax=Novosphingobium sp. 9U TaxID=2653158 RepID=UPI0012F04DF1|nr:TonB-dependent receptor [Novosphingobium sp. 9U]VWX48282.1 conserved exported hypothetical protein [Novosphingobium sp. 9U]